MSSEAITEERQASWLELFFDLVLRRRRGALAAQLHHDRSLAALAVFAGLFVPVWWIWWGFTWYSSAFNDDDAVNRVGVARGDGRRRRGRGRDPGRGPRATRRPSWSPTRACSHSLALLYARAWVRVPAVRPLTRALRDRGPAGAALWLARSRSARAFGRSSGRSAWSA